ncbi:tetraspanin-11-like isoform X1 [Tachypleus tridentatus]|uniref:tetraspanin-11-like isoform X1 n=1 Tax=Tachypleus tridentatus TaxID=6853 RepID=UPI003FD1B535
MIEGFKKFIRYATITANFLILIGGIVLFVIGAWTLVDKSHTKGVVGNDLYFSCSAIFIATGVIAVIITFLGLLGAVKKIKGLLLTYFIILSMTFIVLFVGGVLGFVFRNEVEHRVHAGMLKSVKYYMNDTAVTEAWDTVQKQFNCCGIKPNGNVAYLPYRIWMDMNPNFKITGPQVPQSCCKSVTVTTPCQKNPSSDTTWTSECYENVKRFLQNHAMLLGEIGITIACILMLGLIFSCTLILIGM